MRSHFQKFAVANLLALSSSLIAEPLDFDALWRKIVVESPQLQSIKKEQDAEQSRAQSVIASLKPTIYINGQSVATDNPTMKFMGILNQREVMASDFDPARLTDDNWQFIHQLAAGIRMPLYEGEAKQFMVRSLEKMQEAKKMQEAAIKDQLYFFTAQSYGYVLLMQDEQKAFEKLDATINRLSRRYQLGSKSNRLGYSGLLGLKNLSLSISSIQQQIIGKKTAHEQVLKTQAHLPELSLNLSSSIADFKNLRFQVSPQANGKELPQISAIKVSAQANEDMVGAERARLRPQIAAFAESGVTAGARDIKPSSTVGLSLNWILYNAATEHNIAATQAQSQALIYKAEAETQNAKLQFERLQIQRQILLQNLQTTSESEKILDEQMSVTLELFQNGIVNILPVVDLISRKVDITSKRYEIEEKLLEADAALWLYSTKN